MASRTVSVALVADVGQYQSAMVRAASTTKSVGDSADQASTKTRRAFDGIGRGAGLLAGVVGGALILSLKGAVDAASDAEQSLGGVQAVFKDYANDVIASSKEADRALGLSGNSYRELATVIGSQFKNAGIPMDDLAEKTQGVIEIGADLAAQFGGSTQEAVQALSSAFRGEMDPIERYGISLSAAAVGAKAVEMGLAESATGLDQHAKVMASLALITQQSADAQGAFARESDTAAGRAQRAAAQWENLKVAVGDRLLPAWSALVDVLGTKVIPFMGDVLDVGGDVINFIKENKDVALALAGVLAVQLAGGIGAVNVAFNKMILTPVVLGLSGLLGVAGNLPAAFAAARTAVAGFIATIAPLAAVGVVIYGITKFVEMANAADNAREEIAGMWDAVGGDKARGTAQVQALNDYVDQLADKLAQLRQDEESRGFLSNILEGPFTDRGTTAAIDAYTEALKRAKQQQQETSSSVDALGERFGLNRQQVLDLADKYDIDLTSGLANSRRLFENFYGTEYGSKPTEAVIDLSKATEDAKAAFDDAKKAVDGFKLSLDILTGAHVSMIQVESSLQSAIAEADGALKDLNGSVLDGRGDLDLHSEAGRKAADVLLDVRDSGNDLIATLIQQGATSDDVRKADADLRQSFIDTARQMGISQTAAENLADQILGIPDERTTTINADTAAANAKIAETQRGIDNMHGKDIEINVRAAGRFIVNPQGGLQEFAEGGWTGPGSKYQPAGVVHADEFVVPKSRVNALGGPGRVASLVGMPGYANGGPVAPINITQNTSSLEATMGEVGQAITNAIPKVAAFGGMAGSGVQRWLPLVLQALSMVGQPASLAQTVLRRMQQESGGNPMAINNWDINAKRGTPSKGLMQTIDPTFRAYHFPGTSMNVYDPLANILASMRYAMSRYGSLSAAYNRAGGYAHGGATPAGDPFWVGEQGPELMWSSKSKYVSTAAQSREFAGSSGSSGSSVTVNIEGATIAGTLDFDPSGVVHIIDGRIISAVSSGAAVASYGQK